MDIIEFLNEICNYEHIYIYGAGKYGKTLAAYLLEIGILNQVNFFLITNEGKDKKLFGKPVLSFNSFYKKVKKDDIIVVAVSENKQNDILDNLFKNGVYNVLAMTDAIYKKLKNKFENTESEEKNRITECAIDILDKILTEL